MNLLSWVKKIGIVLSVVVDIITTDKQYLLESHESVVISPLFFDDLFYDGDSSSGKMIYTIMR